jgi:hypothetical protein
VIGDKTPIELAALYFIGWHGDEAPYVLSEYAEAAAGMGDAPRISGLIFANVRIAASRPPATAVDADPVSSSRSRHRSRRHNLHK